MGMTEKPKKNKEHRRKIADALLFYEFKKMRNLNKKLKLFARENNHPFP